MTWGLRHRRNSLKLSQASQIEKELKSFNGEDNDGVDPSLRKLLFVFDFCNDCRKAALLSCSQKAGWVTGSNSGILAAFLCLVLPIGGSTKLPSA